MKNPDYWDPERKPNPDSTELRFFSKEPAQILAVQSGEVNALSHFSATGGRALLTDSNIEVLGSASSVHRQMHMRNDKEPFTDKRVRQALALLIDRAGLVDGLFQGKAALGNDSPFAPVYKYTDKSVPQRKRDVEKAKQLLSEAGKDGGFSVTLDTWDGFEIPDLAQLVQSNAKEGGIDIKLNITDAAVYYGDAVFGKSPWLDSTMGITDYGHRGVVNVFLGAPLLSKGTWNAAHFKNPQYDALVKEFTAQTDIDAQMKAAGQIQDAAARRDADRDPVLLRLPHGRPEGLRGDRDHGDGARPAHRRGTDLSRAAAARGSRGGVRASRGSSSSGSCWVSSRSGC